MLVTSARVFYRGLFHQRGPGDPLFVGELTASRLDHIRGGCLAAAAREARGSWASGDGVRTPGKKRAAPPSSANAGDGPRAGHYANRGPSSRRCSRRAWWLPRTPPDWEEEIDAGAAGACRRFARGCSLWPARDRRNPVLSAVGAHAHRGIDQRHRIRWSTALGCDPTCGSPDGFLGDSAESLAERVRGVSYPEYVFCGTTPVVAAARGWSFYLADRQ